MEIEWINAERKPVTFGELTTGEWFKFVNGRALWVKTDVNETRYSAFAVTDGTHGAPSSHTRVYRVNVTIRAEVQR